MATGRENLFDAVLVKDLMNKVKGKSSLAVLSGQTPIPFNGLKEFIFSMDNEIDIVAENGKKSEGGITVDPVKIVPIKFEYGARVSDEFLYATEEEQLDILTAFNNGFAAKVAKGFDLAAFHGINPRTGEASEILDTLNLTGKKAVYTIAIPKGDEHVWEDNKVEFFGETWKVIGLPQQGIEHNIPLEWNQKWMVERYG